MRGQESRDFNWLTTALVRAGTLASGTALLAAVFAEPAAAQPESAAPPPPAAPAAPATHVQKRDLRVVALGDSYFTGLGAGQYRAGTHRQSLAAGFLQALARLEAANPGLSITVQNNSSSGATIDDLYQPQVEHGWFGDTPVNNPQLDGVDPNADVAIMGLGGNDIGFTSLIEDGVLNNGGAAVRARLAELQAGQLNTGLPDADYLTDADRQHGQQQTVTGELMRAIRDAKARMPHAQIVITTYPEVADPNSTSMLSAIGPEELAAYRDIIRSLNDSIRTAARLTGATVADNSHAFAGHEVYTNDPYLHDLAPQWGLNNRDEAMHPNAAGQTALADAIADAVAKATGLRPAAPYHGPAPYPTNRLTLDPARPPAPTGPHAARPPASRRSTPAPGRGTPQPDKINWTGGPLPIDEAPPQPAHPKPDVPPPAEKPGRERNPTIPGQPPTAVPQPTPPGNPAGHNDQTTPTRPGTDSPTRSPAPTGPHPNPTPGRPGPVDGGRPAKTGPADNPENGGDRGRPVKSGPADNPENGGDRGRPIKSGPADNPENGGGRGRPVKSGPADNPENGGDRGTGSQRKTGPADNPENGGDRGTRATSPAPGRHESGRTGPADNPENGGDRGTRATSPAPSRHESGRSGPADNPGNGGDRGTGSSRSGQPSGRSGPADNPANGGDRDTGSQRSGKTGPADNPENGGDRGIGHSSGSPSGKAGPADNPENGGDRGSASSGGKVGPADNPENGGDRGTGSFDTPVG